MNNIQQIVKVGIADMNIVKAPDVIRTSGLGSCVGVIIYDSLQSIAGLVHVMLPDSSLSRNDPINLAKYADTAISELVSNMFKQGARKLSLKAKIAGGAQMFQFSSGNEFDANWTEKCGSCKETIINFTYRTCGRRCWRK